MRPRWNGQFKNASRTLPDFSSVLELMRTLNRKSTLATADDVSRQRKYTQVQTRRRMEKQPQSKVCAYDGGQ